MLRPLSYVVFALGSFALTCALIRGFVPLPEAGGRREKWEYFDEHADEFHALFLGSSHIFRSIQPRLMEDELAERGVRFHAFNLGFAAARGVEGDYWLQRVLERRPKHLRWIFLEAGFWRGGEQRNPPQYVRFFHTPRVVRHLVAMSLGSDAPLEKRIDAAVSHVMICLGNVANVGEGPRILGLRRDVPDRNRGLGRARLDKDLGYQRLEEADASGRRHADLLERAAQWEVTVSVRKRREQRIYRQAVPEGMVNGPHARLVRDQDARVGAAGHRLIFLAPPRIEAANPILMMDHAGVFPRFLNYGSPVFAPELYEIDLWHDFAHLGHAGSTLFSRLLVERVARMARKRER